MSPEKFRAEMRAANRRDIGYAAIILACFLLGLGALYWVVTL